MEIVLKTALVQRKIKYKNRGVQGEDKIIISKDSGLDNLDNSNSVIEQ